MLIEEVLRKTKVNIVWAKNGLEAVNMVMKNNHFDLVLMDIKMPEMDGFEATLKIKGKHPELPVIAQTAYAMTIEKEKSLEAGCDDYIAKPINPKELIVLISKYI